MALILAFASFLHPFHLSAQECTPDTAASLKHFKTAYTGVRVGTLGLHRRWSAKSGVVHIEAILSDSGYSHNEATIKASTPRPPLSGTVRPKKSRGRRPVGTRSWLPVRSSWTRSYRVARAKMNQALCRD
jgi:hypothetical protein